MCRYSAYDDAADLVIAVSAALKPTKDASSRVVDVSRACYSDFEDLQTLLHLVYLSARVLMAATPGLSAVVRLPSGVAGYADVPAALEQMLQEEDSEFVAAMLGTCLVSSSTAVAYSTKPDRSRVHEAKGPTKLVMSNGSRLAVVQDKEFVVATVFEDLRTSELQRADTPWVLFYLDAKFGDRIDREEAETLLRSTEGERCSGAVVLVYDTSHVEFPASRPYDPRKPRPF